MSFGGHQNRKIHIDGLEDRIHLYDGSRINDPLAHAEKTFVNR